MREFAKDFREKIRQKAEHIKNMKVCRWERVKAQFCGEWTEVSCCDTVAYPVDCVIPKNCPHCGKPTVEVIVWE